VFLDVVRFCLQLEESKTKAADDMFSAAKQRMLNIEKLKIRSARAFDSRFVDSLCHATGFPKGYREKWIASFGGAFSRFAHSVRCVSYCFGGWAGTTPTSVMWLRLFSASCQRSSREQIVCRPLLVGAWGRWELVLHCALAMCARMGRITGAQT